MYRAIIATGFILSLFVIVQCSYGEKTVHDNLLIEFNQDPILLEPLFMPNFINPIGSDGRFLASYSFRDSIFYAITNRPRLELFLFDLKNSFSLLGKIRLDKNFFYKPSGIFVLSPDSIFISDEEVPHIFLIDSIGNIVNDYSLINPTSAIQNENQILSFYSLYYGFSNPFFYDNNASLIYFLQRQMDLWWFTKERKELPVMGIYDLNEKKIKQHFGNYPGYYGDGEKWYLPFYLSHPILTLANELIYVTYPLDNGIYIYNFDGNLINIVSGATQRLKVGQPDLINGDEQAIRELSRSYFLRNSYFGSFIYHEKLKSFFRLYQLCNKNSEGFCFNRQTFILQFNEFLDLVKVFEIMDDGLAPEAIVYEDGLLLRKIEPLSDDLLPFNLFIKP